MKDQLTLLDNMLTGEVYYDALHKTIYATDASVYRKIPLAVAYPKTTSDITKLIDFANNNATSLIPRTAGTSLAGQCVGDGIVVDVSKHFTNIIKVDEKTKQVTVEPGVVRDELNTYLKDYGLFFGPNTSTSNSCMIGGMVGNNSSGTTSIQYGVTREKIVALKLLLSSGEEIEVKNLTKEAFAEKRNLDSHEGKVYRRLYEILSDKQNQEEIISQFPKPEIHRRNTGYAIDLLLDNQIFSDNSNEFNLSKLISGSEGTLGFITEITLQLDELPPAHAAMVVSHYRTLEETLQDVETTMKHELHTCELMDKIILDCTKNNTHQAANRFFIEGDPAAVLMLEVKADDESGLQRNIDELIKELELSGKSYANPVLKGNQIQQALELRKAGLGLLGNMVGDRKAVACIEDTAVALEDLSAFILDFTAIMAKYKQDAVYYAHAGAGELHLRPILDLKKSSDVTLFREITTEVAHLTKQYKGSFSGEHGDGIVRSEFIPIMIGEHNYSLMKEIKSVFDPNNIFNPGKIVDSFPMDTSLRYDPDRKEPEITTLMDFSDSQGILRAAEKCNGSGDCRKSAEAKGAMCPSYHVTKDEKHTTRARANTLREVLTNEVDFNNENLKEVFDLCLSCKACSSECPSNVDIASFKTEFLYQYQEKNGYKLSDTLVAKSPVVNKALSKFSGLSNALFFNGFSKRILRKLSNTHPRRSLPRLSKKSFSQSIKKTGSLLVKNPRKEVVLFVDEFTNYQESEIAVDTYSLLFSLGYQVTVVDSLVSGRTYLSKGFLKEAKKIVDDNLSYLQKEGLENKIIIGIEPSAILSFRDEYLRLASNKEIANTVAENSYLVEEFIANEISIGNIDKKYFTSEKRRVKIHNHCHQKALSNQKVTFDMLNVVENYRVSIISSGCCGMAGSFGYEKEHYDISMKVGELKLFPSIRKAKENVIIAANGTSCRHQIYDGTQRKALHPVSILYQALKR
ncbi:MAG: FAD-binding protein [Flavobacteriaceae bacterium]|nr:FAD-binding protein [Flavobacteriaceae bacterium]